MKEFIQLKKNLKKNFSGFKIVRIAILGDTTTQFLTLALKALGYEYNINFEIYEAGYNQIERELNDPLCHLYTFSPEFVIVFLSTQKLLDRYNKAAIDNQSRLATTELEAITCIYNSINSNINTNIIFYNYNEIDDNVFGNYANKTESSFLFQVRKLNYELMQMATQKTNLFLCDLSSIQNEVGKLVFFRPAIYYTTEATISLDVLPKVAAKTISIINAINGKFKKCIILDLDNTIWGGTIGDDGIENIQIGNLGIGNVFTGVQAWIKKLKNRGIIIAVCSKNTEAIAKEPFEKHPDMILKLADISVFKANWINKVDNIREIQSILNIGFDSMVFLDDNAFERNFVRENIPEICVPELPDDPADYLEYLYQQNLFETVSFSESDLNRTTHYQVETQRRNEQQMFTSEDSFLQNLQMVADVQPFNKFNMPRVAQLSQRSNQFNLRTIRYTEETLAKISTSSDYVTFAFSLEDKFGDMGLICAVVLQKAINKSIFIESWFMSCRVLKRGLENFVLNTIIHYAQKNNFNMIIGEYISTLKNEIVKYHYTNLGFEQDGNYYCLNLKNNREKNSYIKTKN
jgi:FkbH-like protein